MDRFAIVSDVHGNRWALEAVLADLEGLGIAEVVNLGDLFYGPLDPRGTAETLVGRGWPTVCGNEDRLLIAPAGHDSPTLAFTREQLGEDHLDWLRSLPRTLVRGAAVLCHGTPGSDTEYLLWDVDGDGARARTAADVTAALGATTAKLVLCGHDHVPRFLRLPDGRTVANPGSVGLPAYWDDVPRPHVMAAGTPHARYAVLRRDGSGWLVEDRRVTYDWEAAAAAAERNGRPDWAAWLRTGLAAT